MTATLVTASPAQAQDRPARLPGAIVIGLARGWFELRSFFREKDTVIFTFSLPIVMLVILGSLFGDEVEGTGITVSQLFVGGMIAGGIASTSFVTLGVGIAADRADGTLARLRGTPMPAVSYFLGKLLLVLVASLTEVALLLVVGVLMFDMSLPSKADQWFTLGWVFVLGVTACSFLGIALSSLARNTRSAGALANMSLLVLMFASGVYFIPVSRLPEPLYLLGSVFPLKWMAQGARSVFLPDTLASMEAAGAWEHGRVALILAAWCIGGLVLCLATFRWRDERRS